ncbi:LOW QUALITY PROTEIN: concanavalin A-like lectin/glucanase domain-containing protein [Jimgerdemannia flammicorona]|uniref:Concanavalin A-like lectin/glucanase domain-containing protein n=1 Tax=Jimgerdemannia flammicorona TaxID=994334 RepID=A0A433PUD4_9FUNG|nr:LOW QUALITY PROTEIN: concanavalin A-like lectin/glucanase domain-containing protein [Jimgerdemannia flammicorona]
MLSPEQTNHSFRSLERPDQDLQNRWFDFGGDTVINTNKQIRLTSDRQSQTGWLWSRLKQHDTNAPREQRATSPRSRLFATNINLASVPLTATNFQIEFEFKVDGQSPSLYGDGFAFWLTKQRAIYGPVFGFMDKFEGIGIFFDTYPNNRRHHHSFPYVMAMIGDGVASYDNSDDGKSTEIAGCEADFRSISIPTKARVTYYHNNFLELKLQYKGWDEWEHCFTIANVTLSVPYLGFTAITGEVHDNHDIISVSTTTLISVPPSSPVKPQKSKIITKSGMWTAFMWYLKLVAFGTVITVGILIYRMYNSQSTKRF